MCELDPISLKTVKLLWAKAKGLMNYAQISSMISFLPAARPYIIKPNQFIVGMMDNGPDETLDSALCEYLGAPSLNSSWTRSNSSHEGRLRAQASPYISWNIQKKISTLSQFKRIMLFIVIKINEIRDVPTREWNKCGPFRPQTLNSFMYGQRTIRQEGLSFIKQCILFYHYNTSFKIRHIGFVSGSLMTIGGRHCDCLNWQPKTY